MPTLLLCLSQNQTVCQAISSQTPNKKLKEGKRCYFLNKNCRSLKIYCSKDSERQSLKLKKKIPLDHKSLWIKLISQIMCRKVNGNPVSMMRQHMLALQRKKKKKRISLVSLFRKSQTPNCRSRVCSRSMRTSYRFLHPMVIMERKSPQRQILSSLRGLKICKTYCRRSLVRTVWVKNTSSLNPTFSKGKSKRMKISSKKAIQK